MHLNKDLKDRCAKIDMTKLTRGKVTNRVIIKSWFLKWILSRHWARLFVRRFVRSRADGSPADLRVQENHTILGKNTIFNEQYWMCKTLLTSFDRQQYFLERRMSRKTVPREPTPPQNPSTPPWKTKGWWEMIRLCPESQLRPRTPAHCLGKQDNG